MLDVILEWIATGKIYSFIVDESLCLENGWWILWAIVIFLAGMGFQWTHNPPRMKKEELPKEDIPDHTTKDCQGG